MAFRAGLSSSFDEPFQLRRAFRRQKIREVLADQILRRAAEEALRRRIHPDDLIVASSTTMASIALSSKRESCSSRHADLQLGFQPPLLGRGARGEDFEQRNRRGSAGSGLLSRTDRWPITSPSESSNGTPR